ncbi:amidohydrolase/deacetylase family metallohydrolase [Larkinella harenae]
MMKFIVFISALFMSGFATAQEYDLLLQGGHVIDPKNKINRVVDVAIKAGRIAAVEAKIDRKKAAEVVDVSGLYVMPGLIDIHGHVFAGTAAFGALSNGFSSLSPDGFTFRVGVTTIVDAGGPGGKEFLVFKRNIIDRSRTRVLSLLNISRAGMYGDEYSDEQQNVNYMDPKVAAEMALQHKEYIVGFKVAHFHKPDFVAVDRVVEAGKLAGLPVMIDFGGSKPRLSLEELLMRKLRPGDIFTHTYGELLETKEAIVDVETKTLKPYVLAARERGIIFDVGHGGGSFRYTQALPATKAGLFPHTISTDLHTGSMNGAMKDMLNVMSKFLALGMPLEDVIQASTWKPAQVINRTELGHLSVGAIADVTVLNLRKGKFGFFDVNRDKMMGTQKLECELTLKDGIPVYDTNGIMIPTTLSK